MSAGAGISWFLFPGVELPCEIHSSSEKGFSRLVVAQSTDWRLVEDKPLIVSSVSNNPGCGVAKSVGRLCGLAMRLLVSSTALALVFVSAWGLLAQAERKKAISTRHSPAVGHSKAPLSFLSPTERDIVAETNKVRRDPAGYAAELEGWRGRFKGNRIELPASDIRIRSQEGLAALEDAIHALRRSRPAPPLAVSKGMTLAARAHLRDMAGSGKFRHRGTDGSEVVERLRRYGTPKKTAGENLMAGVGDGREVVAALLIDDGVPSRGHRSNILDREFRATGVACGPHPRYRVMCVIAYAGGFVE